MKLKTPEEVRRLTQEWADGKRPNAWMDVAYRSLLKQGKVTSKQEFVDYSETTLEKAS